MDERKRLIDPFGRWIRKLRVSLTDVCNFRCSYCMPGKVRFQPSKTLLSPGELVRMCRGLVDAGIRQIRLTGGEPMARREFREIVEGISELPLDKLGLTTNGYWLEEHLPFLAETQCQHINVSLDSLDGERFREITDVPFFERVHDAIVAAREMGFPVKVNCVLIRGANDHEVEDFVEFSARHGIPVRFLEFMKIGPQRLQFDELFISADDIIERLRRRWTLEPVSAPKDTTAFSFRTDHGAEIGFIASESRPFCQHCSRLRLTARGHLRACLFKEDGLDLKGVALEDYPEVLEKVMPMKPYDRPPYIEQPMYQIGG